MEKLTINELFSGIGAQVAALKRLGIEYETVGIAEIDRFAIQSYEAINGKTRNYGDVSKVERLDYADLWTYSSPCQDFSIAGNQRGLYDENGEQTRSGLLLEVERLLKTAIADGEAPKYLLLENVKNLVGKKFKPDFDRWLNTLERLGYRNHWQVLNAKDYGVPQNRERVFVVSIRKDIYKGYSFPAPFPLELRLKDILELSVDEKFYLSDKLVQGFLRKNERDKEKGNGFRFEPQDRKDPYAKAILAGYASCKPCSTYIKEPMVEQVGNLYPSATRDNPNQGRVYDAHGIAACLNCMGGGNQQPHIIEHNTNFSIRKLTPRECWRLMAFTDEEFNKAQQSGVSNSQLYKQAGNSIVVDVLKYIFQNLFKETKEKSESGVFQYEFTF